MNVAVVRIVRRGAEEAAGSAAFSKRSAAAKVYGAIRGAAVMTTTPVSTEKSA